MRSAWAFVFAGVCGLACGGGGGGGAGGSFCHDWATAFCHRIYQCPPADGTGAFSGSSESQCAAGYAKLCSDGAPAGETFDVNCSGGKPVNTAARKSCLDRLASVSCSDFNDPSYSDSCSSVCANGGGGGSSGGGSGGASGGGSGGASGSSGPVGACMDLNAALCNKGFACIPASADRDALLGKTVADCEAMVDGICPSATCTGQFDQNAADACVQMTASESCDAFNNSNTPSVCNDICLMP